MNGSRDKQLLCGLGKDSNWFGCWPGHLGSLGREDHFRWNAPTEGRLQHFWGTSLSWSTFLCHQRRLCVRRWRRGEALLLITYLSVFLLDV